MRLQDLRVPGMSELSRGRLRGALAAVQAGRRGVRDEGRLRLDLLEGDLLLRLGKPTAALEVASRALLRVGRPGEGEARLRLVRGEALVGQGRRACGRAEVDRGLASSSAPLTRSRAWEIQAALASQDGDHPGAAGLLEQALQSAVPPGNGPAVLRVLGRMALLLRDEGRLEEALAIDERRVGLAAALGRPDLLAAARTQRGGTLSRLGFWGPARQDLEAAWEVLMRLGDDRATWLVGVERAALDIARGELPGARRLLDAALEWLAREQGEGGRIADARCRLADLELAGGDAAAAAAQAEEAVRGATALGDGPCASRARIRLAQALLAQGRTEEAGTEARRALAAASPSHAGIRGLASLVLGGVLLRGGAAESAREAFTAATRLSGGRRGLLAAARLGETLCGRLPARGELEEHLRAVEAFGDLRLWAFCLAEVRRLAPEPAAPRVEAAGSPPFDQPAVERALDSEGPWPLRVCRALRALHHRLPWWRAGLLDGGEGWEARWDLDEPRPLPAADLFGLLPRPEGPPVVVDLGEDPALRDHPARALHALRFAVVASLAGDARLVLGLRGTPPGPEALRALAHLVWLVDRHRPVARDGASGEARPSPRVNGLLGRCEAMRALLADIDRMAPSDLALHVWGETGTGKERVARALHDGSPRRGAAFVAVNASSLSDELFESEMFGHVRGAFTGALADREGHVGSAQGGTLFLDEVADLSPRAQARLLRFLEQHEYRRVGESRLRRADVRVVTAANAVLSERVAEGRFRPDLMYRLERLTLRLPPLRERGEDVVLLARHFLRAEAQRARLKAPELSREAARLLERHAWPGNVRELENEMSRLVWMGVGGLVRPEHLAPRLREGEGPAFASLRDALTRCERAHLQRTLAGLGGHRARAAAALGISRQALLTKMVRHGL